MKRILKGEPGLKNQIADLFQVHISTVNRWIQNDDPLLTTMAALDLIQKATGIKPSDQLEKPADDLIEAN